MRNPRTSFATAMRVEPIGRGREVGVALPIRLANL